jgi:3-hydroxyacyl-CoA dehydrogenase
MTAITDMVDLEEHGEIAVLVVDNPPVNALSRGVRDGLSEGIERAEADPGVKAIVIVCEGRTFIAGADIREFGKPREGGNPTASIEAAAKPLIAATHGTVLGGGLELAMSCHFRVALASTGFGLPEVLLGILPGAGGTQRLPRIVGVEKALQMITSGDRIGADEALASGLIDEIVEGDLKAAGVAFAQKVLAEGRSLTRIRDRNDKIDAARGKPEIFANFRKSIARRTRGFEAPEYCVQAVEAAVNLPFDEGIKKERELFAKAVSSDQSAAQRYYFFAERQANKIPDVPADTPQVEIRKVGMLGAGTMGGGISMNFANAGIPVTLVEVKQELLDRGLGVVRKNYERTASRGRISQQDVEERMALLSGSLDMEAFADCDLVIEAVFENMDFKKKVFAELDRICKPDAILASNTSALNLNEIASATERPESVIGLHFFSPANVMKLLEIVRGEETSKTLIATSMAMARRIEKIPVLVGVCRGFVGNRLLGGRRAEADKLIFEGAMPWDVDRVLFDFGLPMGPFAMSDLAGLDIGWDPAKSKGETLRDRLCEAGRRGQKTGKGYYDYDPETRAATPNADVEKLVIEFSEKMGFTRRAVSDEEILQRCQYPMVNEGARILEEGIAIRASDIDVVWCNGYGWPKYRGGPMYWADSIGLDNIVATMKEFQAQHGDHWQPAPLLERLAAEGKRFTDS